MGWGVATIFSSAFLINPEPKQNFVTIEILILSISDTTMKTPTMIVVVYQAPGPYTEFLCEFPEYLSTIDVKRDKVIILSYFSISVDAENDSLCTAFLSLLY